MYTVLLEVYINIKFREEAAVISPLFLVFITSIIQFCA